MRDLKRNQKLIYCSLYQGDNPVFDENGFETGETKSSYTEPTSLKINVSASKGEASDDLFGKDVSYDKVLSTSNTNLPLDEYSRLWVDVKPQKDDKGNQAIKHDYIVKKVAKGLNSALYAIERVARNE